MRLYSVEITNFRVIRKVHLDFPDCVVGIIGPNGAGKSSLVESISWALYGNQVARSDKNEIKSQLAGRDENCEVNLEFGVNDERYRIIRRLVGRNERAEVQLFRGEISESVGIKETKACICRLLGLDSKGFLTSFLARQQELNALSDLQPSRRRDHLAGMLGIERLDKAIIRVKDNTRQSGEQVTFIERQLAVTDQIPARIEELTKLVGELHSKEALRSIRLKEMVVTSGKATEELAKLQEARADWAQLTARIEAEQKTKTSLMEQRDALQKEAVELAALKEEMKGLDKKLVTLESVRREHDKMKEAKNGLTVRMSLTGQIEETETALCRSTEMVSANAERLMSCTRSIESIPADIKNRLDKNKQELEQARTEYNHKLADRVSLGNENEKLQKQIQSVAEFGPDSVCDRCHRTLGDDLPRIRDHLNRELENLKKKVVEIDVQLQEMKRKGQSLRELADDLDRKARVRYEATVNMNVLLKEKESLRNGHEETERRLKSLNVQMKKLEVVSFDQRELDRLYKELSDLETARSRRSVLDGNLARSPAVRRGIEDISLKIELSDRTANNLQEKRKGLSYNPAEFELSQKKLEETQRELDIARDEYHTVSKELELMRKELEEKLTQEDNLRKARAELEERRTDQYYGQKLGSLLTEFRKYLIAGIRPTLADFSSRLLSEMTDGKYDLVELDENYNLRIMDGGQYFGVDRFSGGEKDLANLCLRLAISLALTESAGLNRSFVILDEVFGSQDNERKDLIIKALCNLRRSFPQIFLITHVEDIKDQVEELIEIRPAGQGCSEIRLNNVPV